MHAHSVVVCKSCHRVPQHKRLELKTEVKIALIR